jgi:ketosteroid isomerase-like protein
MSLNRVGAIEAADALTDAIRSGDPSALQGVYAPEAVVWHNTDGLEQKRDDVIAGVQALHAACKVAIEVLQREATADGFVQTQHWTFTPPTGEPLEASSAFWVTLNERRQVVRLDEYIDGAALAALGSLIAAAASDAASTATEELDIDAVAARDAQIIRDLFVATDTFDVDNVVPFLDDHMKFRFGNADPLLDLQTFRSMVIEFNASLGGIRHEIKSLWTIPEERVVVAVLVVHYTRLDGSQISLPCCDVFQLGADHKITSYDIFMDINPVFAA